MNNVKVKGVLDESGVKNFMIINTETRETHIALRDGQKFTLGEFRGTLTQCKQLVAASQVVYPANEEHEMEAQEEGNWDCVHPCALLVKLWAEPHVKVMFAGLAEEIGRTLDSFGWIKPNGEIDFDAVEENYKKWSKSPANK